MQRYKPESPSIEKKNHFLGPNKADLGRTEQPDLLNLKELFFRFECFRRLIVVLQTEKFLEVTNNFRFTAVVF